GTKGWAAGACAATVCAAGGSAFALDAGAALAGCGGLLHATRARLERAAATRECFMEERYAQVAGKERAEQSRRGAPARPPARRPPAGCAGPAEALGGPGCRRGG